MSEERWLVLQAFLDADGSVLEWEPVGTFTTFRPDATSLDVVREVERVWPLRGTPLNAISWEQATEEQREAAQHEDRVRQAIGRPPPLVNEAITAVQELARRGGLIPSTSDRSLLLLEAPAGSLDWLGSVMVDENAGLHIVIVVEGVGLPDDFRSRLGQIASSVFVGFFDAATQGLPLIETDRIREMYGETLIEGYAGAGAQFLRFATTYWTYSALLEELRVRRWYDRVVTQLLEKIERLVGDLFFPQRGPMMIDPKRPLCQDSVRQLPLKNY